MIKENTAAAIEALSTLLHEDQIFTGDKTEKLSKDFYWYSPVLKAA